MWTSCTVYSCQQNHSHHHYLIKKGLDCFFFRIICPFLPTRLGSLDPCTLTSCISPHQQYSTAGISPLIYSLFLDRYTSSSLAAGSVLLCISLLTLTLSFVVFFTRNIPFLCTAEAAVYCLHPPRLWLTQRK